MNYGNLKLNKRNTFVQLENPAFSANSYRLNIPSVLGHCLQLSQMMHCNLQTYYYISDPQVTQEI